MGAVAAMHNVAGMIIRVQACFRNAALRLANFFAPR